jgi:predicted glycosyltransferase involved in capsule biosynthesis
VIPLRDIGRANCIETVIQNVRAQRFPVVQIIISEQDDKEILDKSKMPCVDYIFSKNPRPDLPFSKSQAFNDGVKLAKNNNLILHDADMLVRGDYTSIMNDLLNKHESVHIGLNVCYMTKESTDKIVSEYKINEKNVLSDRVVNYYEGGSLGIRKDIYIKIGGFDEEFIGYGCEDCEFFYRMKNATDLFNERTIDLFHLWHGRTTGWEKYHEANKKIQSRIFSTPLDVHIKQIHDYLVNKYKA